MRAIGIDFGITNSVVAVGRAPPRVLPNREGQSLTPSVVSFVKKRGTDDGEFVVGRQAIDNAQHDPENAARFAPAQLRSRAKAAADAEAKLKGPAGCQPVASQSSRPALWLSCLMLLAGSVGSGSAHAHVKWFSEYDLKKPPLPIGEVLTGQFVYFFLSSVLLIYAFFWVDRYVLRKRILQDVLRRYTVSEPVAFMILHYGAFVFFAAVSAYGMLVQAFFLTPELKTDQRWVPWLQLGMALCALHRRTVPLIGLGIAGLCIAAVKQYGIFHLLDYQILVGVAYFFLAAAMPGPGWLMSRYIALYASTGLMLLWAAVEKWGYASWSYPLLAREPNLLMGFEPYTYMVLAGFVEFNLTFMLLSSASLLSRAVALGFGSVFALAIFKFGMLDAIGHLPCIAVLFVLAVRGPTEGRNFLVLEQKSLWTEAYFMTGLYVLAFVLVFIAYYGLHFLAYGN